MKNDCIGLKIVRNRFENKQTHVITMPEAKINCIYKVDLKYEQHY